MEYKKGLIFGIDLGVGSVGWAVLDENGNKYVDKGVVKFEQAQTAENRRNSRGVRRRLHRRKYRIERMKLLLKEYGLNDELIVDSSLLEKRINGLTEKIELQDVINIIFYFTMHRGYIPFDKETRESELVINLKEKFEYPCLIQKELLKINNKYRTTENPILHSDYEKELKKILEVQSNYYNELTEDFISSVINIINTKRKFWEGPGAPRNDSLTKYGRYRNEEDIEKYQKDNNYRKYLFQDLIGECSVYSGEKKASSYNYYAELFNFYNDFVNLRFPKSQISFEKQNSKYFTFAEGDAEEKKYKLTSESILKIRDYIFSKDKIVLKTMFKELFDVEEFAGYKKDSDGKPDVYRFQTTKRVKNLIQNQELYSILFDNIDVYNKVISMIQISPDSSSRYEMIEDVILKSRIEKLNDREFIANLSEIEIENRYHSFSEKALKTYLNYMIEDNENSSKIERVYKEEIASDIEEEIVDEYLENIEEGKLKYINDKFVDDIIASPTTKKSIRKAEAVINKLFSKYGYPEVISIETTRDLLSAEKQKEYDNKTLDNAQKRKNALSKILKDGYEGTEVNINKYLLMQETKCKCAYCNRDVKIENSEIEHILPRSITCDDSFDNKTISCTECNTIKSNRSPYQYLSVDGRYEEFKERIQKNKDISDKKKSYLLFEENLNKYEKNFKNRNLNETAYATNELAKQINIFKVAYKESTGKELETRVLRVPGQFTHLCREKFGFEKDRSLEYHHAVDALIVANYVNTKMGKLMNLVQNEKDKYWKVKDLEEFRNQNELFDQLFMNKELIKIIKDADFSNTRLSREVVKKINGQLFDADVKKAIIKNGQYFVIEQIDNIYDLSHDEVIKKIKNEDGLLIKEKNPKLYEKLLNIIEKYKDEKGNQFVAYCKENYDEDWTKVKFNPHIHGVRVSNKANSDVVIKLRFIKTINVPFILDKKSVNKKEGTINVCTTLSSYGTRIFKDENKLYFMPMYRVFVDFKTGKLKENSSYYKEVYNKYVGKENVEFLMDLFTNDYVRFEDKNGNVSEGYVSYFHKTLNKIVIKNSNSITASSINVKKIKSDILGLYNLNI